MSLESHSRPAGRLPTRIHISKEEKGMCRKLLATVVILGTVAAMSKAGKEYDFQKKPAAALETVARLKHLSTGRQGLTGDESALIADVQNGQLNKLSFAEAALIASGITDASQRKPYLTKIDQLEAGARQATAAGTTPAAKADKLLQFLHAGVMKPGYSGNQTSLAVLLDTGKYNCVSSAVLYNIIGRRLGLDLRGVLEIGHAFSVLHESGRSHEVQTTSTRGFQADDPKVQKEVEEKTGIKTRKRINGREVGEAGLTAVIYSNRSAELGTANRYYEALLLDFSALALDSGSESALNNCHAHLANWGKHLCGQGQYETALTVLAVGRELAPKDYSLQNNRNVVWQEWVKTVYVNEGEEPAKKLIRRLRKDIPDDRDLRDIVRSHVVRGMKKLEEAKDYAAALAFIDRHRDVLKDAAEAKGLSVSVYVAWARPFVTEQKWPSAIEVYQTGLAVYPNDSDLKNSRSFVWQEWIKTVYVKEGEESAKTLIRRLLKDNPGDSGMRDLVSNHVIRGMKKLEEAKDYGGALAFVERHRDVLKDADEAKNLSLSVYDAWAGPYMKEKKWSAAIEVYQAALAVYPKDSHLTNNLKYCERENKK
jgi:tetratricopeptide (TPR) repeat protein